MPDPVPAPVASASADAGGVLLTREEVYAAVASLAEKSDGRNAYEIALEDVIDAVDQILPAQRKALPTAHPAPEASAAPGEASESDASRLAKRLFESGVYAPMCDEVLTELRSSRDTNITMLSLVDECLAGRRILGVPATLSRATQAPPQPPQLPDPDVAEGDNGSIGFEWISPNNILRKLYFDVGPGERWSVYARLEDGRTVQHTSPQPPQSADARVICGFCRAKFASEYHLGAHVATSHEQIKYGWSPKTDARVAELEAALSPVLKFIEINDGDTLSRTMPNSECIAIASGSWSGSFTLTLGHLREIVRIAKEQRT